METPSTSSSPSSPLRSNIVHNAISASKGATGVEAFLARAELSKVGCLRLLTPLLRPYALSAHTMPLRCLRHFIFSLLTPPDRQGLHCGSHAIWWPERALLSPLDGSFSHSRVSPASHVSILHLYLITMANMFLFAFSAESRAQSSTVLCIIQSKP